jgi:hypothetical protein
LSAETALALAAMLLFGVADLVYKRGAAAGAAPHQFLMVQTWVFFPTVTAYALLTGTLHLGPAALWGTFAGGFMLSGSWLFVRSVRDPDGEAVIRVARVALGLDLSRLRRRELGVEVAIDRPEVLLREGEKGDAKGPAAQVTC